MRGSRNERLRRCWIVVVIGHQCVVVVAVLFPAIVAFGRLLSKKCHSQKMKMHNFNAHKLLTAHIILFEITTSLSQTMIDSIRFDSIHTYFALHQNHIITLVTASDHLFSQSFSHTYRQILYYNTSNHKRNEAGETTSRTTRAGRTSRTIRFLVLHC